MANTTAVQILIPLLGEQQHSKGAADCLCAILDNNAHTCVALGPTLIQTAADLARGHQRHAGYLAVLEKLMVVDGRPNMEMQLAVCREMVSPTNELWQADGGKIGRGEWGEGPKVARVKMVEIVLLGEIPEDSQTYTRTFGHKNAKLRVTDDNRDITEETMNRCV